jgi:hypothetical protein
MKKKDYCTQNNGDCLSCSLASYGRDCKGNEIRRGTKNISVSLPIGLVDRLDAARGNESKSAQIVRLVMAGMGLSEAEQLQVLRGK